MLGLAFEDAAMGSWKSVGPIVGPALLLMTAAGCTISIQPWTKPVVVAPQPDPAALKPPLPGYPPNYPPNTAPPNGYPPGAYPPTPYPATPYPATTASLNEYNAQLVKQLNEKDDQNKALLDQMQGLKRLSRERDDYLQHASYEMDESSKQIKRTRDEVRQFSGEIEDMRERIRKLEEMRSALKPLLDEILYHLERDKEAARLPRVQLPGK
jgi:hypothetical protein